ncbi:MAG: hypothetical protein DVB22_001037 [Verrucomicrobia bacterium]|nr:MAG: hypothetical protein DVB22_001037 [Verrucomicrobiota bacterium]
MRAGEHLAADQRRHARAGAVVVRRLALGADAQQLLVARAVALEQRGLHALHGERREEARGRLPRRGARLEEGPRGAERVLDREVHEVRREVADRAVEDAQEAHVVLARDARHHRAAVLKARGGGSRRAQAGVVSERK